MECDEHVCADRSLTPCGDGQCVLAVDIGISAANVIDTIKSAYLCSTLRNLAFRCEMYLFRPLWTLKDGFCAPVDDEWGSELQSGTIVQRCLFWLKCVLSGGLSTRCPDNNISNLRLIMLCEPILGFIEYPTGPVLNSFVRTFYGLDELIARGSSPHYMRVHGRFRCAGFQLTVTEQDFRIETFSVFLADRNMCRKAATLDSDISFMRNHSSLVSQFDSSCWSDWLPLFNVSTGIEVAAECNEFCLSPYRIHDGYLDCRVGDFDEKPLSRTIDQQRGRHCLNCISDKLQRVCLSVVHFSASHSTCARGEDKYLVETDVSMATLQCNDLDASQCHLIRAHIAETNTQSENTTRPIPSLFTASVPPFGEHCDTYLDTHTGEDEAVEHCLYKWTCASNEYRCLTGQCIPFDWLCDGK